MIGRVPSREKIPYGSFFYIVAFIGLIALAEAYFKFSN